MTNRSPDEAPIIEPTTERVRLYPAGQRFINGIAKSYENDFPPELEKILDEQYFEVAINQINNTLTDYWPCTFCIGCGYACCLCTAGASLFCPSYCVGDAENYTRTLIKRINYRRHFQDRGIEWELVKKCGVSWIEISYPSRKGLKTTKKSGDENGDYVEIDVPDNIASGTYGSNST